MNKKIQHLYNWAKSLHIKPHVLRAAQYPLIMRYIRFCLIILTLVMPFTACFPEKSDFIEAQKKKDGAMEPWETELTNKEQEWKKGLEDFKKNKPKLNDEGLDPGTLPDGELKTLFEDKCKPYLEAFEGLLTKYIKENINPANRSDYEGNLLWVKAFLAQISNWRWSEKSDKKQMLGRIKSELQKFKL